MWVSVVFQTTAPVSPVDILTLHFVGCLDIHLTANTFQPTEFLKIHSRFYLLITEEYLTRRSEKSQWLEGYRTSVTECDLCVLASILIVLVGQISIEIWSTPDSQKGVETKTEI